MSATNYGTDNIENLIKFLYGAAGYPAISTLLKAVKKGYFDTWPGMTEKRIKKYLLNDIISAKGHMHLKQQVKTKIKIENKMTEIEDQIINPNQEKGNEKTGKNKSKNEK